MTPSLTSPVLSGVRVSSGPLCAHIALYRGKLEELGYSPEMVLYRLRLIAKLDHWLLRRSQRLWSLNEEVVGRFLGRLRRRYRCQKGAVANLRLLLKVLRDAGAVALRNETPPQSLA